MGSALVPLEQVLPLIPSTFGKGATTYPADPASGQQQPWQHSKHIHNHHATDSTSCFKHLPLCTDVQRGTGKEGQPLLSPGWWPQLPLHTTCSGSTSTTTCPHTAQCMHMQCCTCCFMCCCVIVYGSASIKRDTWTCSFFSGVAPRWEMLPFFPKKCFCTLAKPTKRSSDKTISPSSFPKNVALDLANNFYHHDFPS